MGKFWKGVKFLGAVLIALIIVVIALTAVENTMKSQVPQTKSSGINTLFTGMYHTLYALDSMLVQGQFRLAPYDTINPGVRQTANLYGRNNTLLFNSTGSITRITGLSPGTIFYIVTTATTDTLIKGVNLQIASNFVGTTTHASIELIVIDTNIVELGRSAN